MTINITLDSAGNAGIGTPSPNGLLDVKVSTGRRVVTRDSGDVPHNAQLAFTDDAGGYGSMDGHIDANFLRLNYLSGGGVYVGNGDLNYSGSVFAALYGSSRLFSSYEPSTTSAYLFVQNSGASGRNWGFRALGTNTTLGPVGGFVLRDETANLTRMTLDSAGNVGIGTAAPLGKLHTQADGSNLFLMDGYSDTAGQPPQMIFRRARGTFASPTATASGNYLSIIDARGYQTTTNAFTGPVGRINFFAAEAFTSTAQGTFISFDTTPIGSTTIAERMRIDSAGNIYGTAGATGMTNGFIYIPSAAGAPTGTPSAISGHVPMYFDTTGNFFYAYNGSWKKIAMV